jgi:hypothetical protein
MRKRVSESSTKVELKEDFKLQLPAELNIDPLFTVALPAKHVALIYKDSHVESRRGTNGLTHDVTVDGFRYVVKKDNGEAAKNPYINSRFDGNFYESELKLKLALEYDAQVLMPKKVTRTRRDEEEDEG